MTPGKYDSRNYSITIIVCLSLFLFMTGCATTLPPHIADPAKHAKFQVSEYITAVGMSDVGFSEAENFASAKVAQQLKSKISYHYEMAMKDTGIFHDGKVTVDAHFSHAEMIRIDTTSGAKVGQLYYAFAYLPRRDVFNVLSNEYESEAVKFRRAVQSIAGQEADLPAYTAAFRQAYRIFSKLAAKSFELLAVTQRQHPPFQKDTALFQRMEQNRISLLRTLKLTVRIQNTNHDDAREVILMALTGALTRLGLEATPGVCSPQKYELRIQADVNCKRGSFGPQCALDMDGALVHCSSGNVLAQAELSDPAFKGLHTKDKNRALTQLYNSITANELTPLLQKALAGVLPIDELTVKTESSL